MGDMNKCKYCGGDIEIRNPTGHCDHLYYPENCEGYKNESFEEMCIRTGHKPFGAQGIDGSKYKYNSDGTVSRK